MCWQDVQISRQCASQTITAVDGGNSINVQLQAEPRRVRLNFSGFGTGGITGTKITINIYQGTVTDISHQVFSQEIIDPFSFDSEQYGMLLTGPLLVSFTGDGDSSVITMVEMLLYDPLGLGEPTFQGGR